MRKQIQKRVIFLIQVDIWQTCLSRSRHRVWESAAAKQTGSALLYLWLSFLYETVVRDLKIFCGDLSFSKTDTETLWQKNKLKNTKLLKTSAPW